MNFGHTKTKLDYILELGFRRMGEAVERAIRKDESFQDIIDSAANQIRKDGEFLAKNIGNIYDTQRRDAAEAQRQYNASQTGMVNMLAVGQQSAVGSPEYQLGAAYRQSRGML